METKSFNVRLYEDKIKSWVPKINVDDLCFVANRSAKIYQRINDPCTDNYRVSRVVKKRVSKAYKEAQESGCCGSTDVEVKNPWTGNVFMIGYNYGH